MASASINDIKSRIKSVNGTMQITKAMELVATSKLRHAKLRAENSKPYLKALSDAIRDLSSFIPSGESVFTENRTGRTLYIVIAGDRGLAGGYNSNIFKLVSSLDVNGDGIYLPIGKKARDNAEKRGKEIFSSSLTDVADVKIGECFNIAKDICDAYRSGSFTSVKLIYTRFASMLSQVPTASDVLPLLAEDAGSSAPICEGEASEVIEKIVPEYVGGIIHAAVCEAFASECAARRTAMNSANKNAEEMISSLTLKFNRARQAVITQEITEIVSGAEAL